MKPKIMPRILVDARMVGPIPHGISRYVSYLAQALKELEKSRGLTYRVTFLVNQDFPHHHFFSFEILRLKSKFLSAREMTEIPRTLANAKADLYHSPSFSSLFTCPCPSMVTVHDLNHLHYGNLPKKLYYKILLKKFALESRAIITVSEFSRRELSDWLKVPDERIEIVYNVIGEPTENPKDTSLLKKHGLEPGSFFFCLSNPKPHKNLNKLTEAYRLFTAQKKEPWPLVITVDPQFISGSKSIKSIGSLPENETAILLKSAAGAFFPSRYEGFGLPPVEAAVAGIPIAVSQIPPHREGLGDLKPWEAFWADPDDIHGWVSAFHKISRNEITAPSAESRQKILDRFNLKRMGDRMDQIYKRVLGLEP